MVRIAAIGDNVTDCYVDRGTMYPGGNCVNVAVWAARAGAETAYVGQVGDDERGALLCDALAAEGVDTTRVRVVPGVTSRTVVRHIDGDRYFGATDKGVRVFTPTVEDVNFVAGFDLAHVSYCSELDHVVADISRHVAVSYDFDDRIRTRGAEKLLRHVTVAAFSGSHLDDDDAADVVSWAHSCGARWVILTRGGLPAHVSNGTRVEQATPRPITAVDTLGAGDAFIGRVLVGIVSKTPLHLLAGNAVKAGAQACLEPGGFGHGKDLTDDDGGLQRLLAVRAN
ncbi:PfkB family carbohydrate kinase [Georgenia sp. TF02-10]|uniref:PfkB family carbohydrate kinase n=1 Tax=Georgenia sp. TF02-10 TaxID=2917725 RepID=UPI001FA80B15|nr:PfkB family carbohydrate kinase [Georgenia sp. TF02-10]UNX54934.1 PfkB family carbohydrate kinase [Georgenia sp. TF02-10]